MTKSVTQSSFNLLANPFALLSVSMSADGRAIENAFEDALTDGVASEAELQRARQALMTPRLRLNAEVRYLPDLSPSRFESVVKGLRQSDLTTEAALSQSLLLEPLARSNFLAHVFTGRKATSEALVSFLQAQAKIKPSDILSAINKLREPAGIVLADIDPVFVALRELFDEQNKQLLSTYDDPKYAAEVVSAAVNKLLQDSQDHGVERLDAFLKAYGQVMDPNLSRAKEGINDCCEMILKNIGVSRFQSDLDEKLKNWAALASPLILHEAKKGRDDPRAREVFEQIRNIYLDLANAHKNYIASENILKITKKTFGELPRASAQINEDAEALGGLLSTQTIQPLIDYIAEQKDALYYVAEDLTKSGFGPESKGRAKKIYDFFAHGIENLKGSENSDLPWIVVRGLALSLNNDIDMPAGSIVLLTVLLKLAEDYHLSVIVRDQLENDLRTAQRIVAQRELVRNVKLGKNKKVLSIISDLEIDPDSAEEKKILAHLKWKSTLSLYKTYGFFSVVIIFLLVLVYGASQNRNSGSNNYTPTYSNGGGSTYSPSQYAVDATPAPLQFDKIVIPPAQQYNQPSVPAPNTNIVKPAVQQNTESRPYPGDGQRVLSLAEIRYCLYQDVRLESLRAKISSSEVSSEFGQYNRNVDQFNLLIADLNSRCSNYKYRVSDMENANAGLEIDRARLSAEGRDLFLGSPSAGQNIESNTEQDKSVAGSQTNSQVPPVTAPAPEMNNPVHTVDASPSEPVSPTSNVLIQPTGDNGGESMPSIGSSSREFHKPEIRYCLFQDVRLAALGGVLSTNQEVAQYNLMVADWNGRCSKYNYSGADLSDVRHEVELVRARLLNEGRSMVKLLQQSNNISSAGSSVSAAGSSSVLPVQNVTNLPASANQSLQTALSNQASSGNSDSVATSGSILDADGAIDLLNIDGAVKVQQRLHDLGYFNGVVDGVWGDRSRRALQIFKLANNLGENDLWDVKTQQYIFMPSVPHAGALPDNPIPPSPSRYSAPFGAQLNPLNKAEAIRIQKRLQDLGYYAGAGDGVWGWASRYALRDFKAANGLPNEDSWNSDSERALLSKDVIRASDTVIGLWARNSEHCGDAQSGSADLLRITSYKWENSGQICKVAGLIRNAQEWTVIGDCPSGTFVQTYVLRGQNLSTEGPAGNSGYFSRCSSN